MCSCQKMRKAETEDRRRWRRKMGAERAPATLGTPCSCVATASDMRGRRTYQGALGRITATCTQRRGQAGAMALPGCAAERFLCRTDAFDRMSCPCPDRALPLPFPVSAIRFPVPLRFSIYRDTPDPLAPRFERHRTPSKPQRRHPELGGNPSELRRREPKHHRKESEPGGRQSADERRQFKTGRRQSFSRGRQSASE